MPKVAFARGAQKDLDEIFDYIARDSYARAITFAEELRQAFLLRAEMPLAGRRDAFLRSGVLWFPHGDYIF